MTTRIVGCPSCGTRNRVPAVGAGRPRCAACHADLPWIVDAGDADLDRALDTSALVLLDLWAPWCGPCRAVAPVLERIATRYAGRVKVVKVNVDHNPASANRFDARSIPLLVLLRDAAVRERVVGAVPEPTLAAAVDRWLAAG